MDQTFQLLQTVYTFRGIERLLIQVGAVTCVVAGTMLYRWGVAGDMEASGKGAGAEIKLSHAAPGSVLALFGMVIMVVALSNPAKFEPPTKPNPSTAPGASVPAPSTSSSAGVAGAPTDRPGSILYSDRPREVDGFMQKLREDQTAGSNAIADLANLASEAKGLTVKMVGSRGLLLMDVAAATATTPDDAAAKIRAFHLRAKDLQ